VAAIFLSKIAEEIKGLEKDKKSGAKSGTICMDKSKTPTGLAFISILSQVMPL
jgi:hypothetical protein